MTTTLPSTDGPPPRARAAAIWVLSAAIAAAAAFVLLATRDLPPPAPRPGIPWWALAIGFYLAECAVVHVHLRRETHTLSLSEVPLVLGLFAVSPLGLVTAQLAGMAVALVFYRRQRPLKIVFNLAQSALGNGARGRRLPGDSSSDHDPLGPVGWLGRACCGLARSRHRCRPRRRCGVARGGTSDHRARDRRRQPSPSSAR